MATSILFNTTRLRTQARPYRYTEAPTRRIRHDGAETAKWKTSAHEFYHRVAFLVALDDLMSDLTDRLEQCTSQLARAWWRTRTGRLLLTSSIIVWR